jgi:hypothetical protein
MRQTLENMQSPSSIDSYAMEVICVSYQKMLARHARNKDGARLEKDLHIAAVLKTALCQQLQLVFVFRTLKLLFS